MTALIVVVALALAVSFGSTLLESVLLATSLSHISELEEEEDPSGRVLAEIREAPEDIILALLALNTVAHTLGAAVAGALAFRIWGDARVAAFVLFLSLATLLLAEVLPRSLGTAHWRRLIPLSIRALVVTGWVMRPVTVAIRLLDQLLGTRSRRGRRASPAEFDAMAGIERRGRTLDDEEWQVVANVLNLDQVALGAVMTPRTEIVAIRADATVAEAIDLMLEEGHLRIPVYEESLDRIGGILLARDLWKAAREGVQQIHGIVRPATFVPFTKPVEDQIAQMREQRIKMAIVLDEFGGTAGIVTLEDLIEEIIGEIRDEHEQEPLPFEEEMEGQVRVRGEVALWEVNERFDLDLPEDVYDTLGGFVFGQIGRIPDVGDEVQTPRGRFRVVAMDGRRVTRVAFMPRPDAGAAEL